MTTRPQRTSQHLPIEVRKEFSFRFPKFTIFAVILFFEGEDFLKIPSGARNGVENGLELLLDVEAFEYASIIFESSLRSIFEKLYLTNSI